MIRVAIFAVVFLQVSTCLDILEKSESFQLIQGDQGSMFCKSDVALDFCMWEKDTFSCKVTSTEEPRNCGPFSAVIEGDNCVLNFAQGAVQQDSGTFTCYLYQEKDVVEETVDVEVLVPSTLNFADDFAANDVIEVQREFPINIGCSAFGGFPAPEIIAFVEDINGEIQELPEVVELKSEELNEHGESVLTQKFQLIPTIENDGNKVVCEVIQGDKALSPNIERDISVVYPPEEVLLDIPFQYKSGDQTVVGVTFKANPVPASNEIIWHHHIGTDDETQPPSPGSLILEAGQTSEDGKYEALLEEVDGHEVTAILHINDPSDQLLVGSWHLEVQNSQGSQEYPFSFEEFQLTWSPIDYYGTTTPEPPVDSMGGGTIAAIIIVILVVVIGLALTAWAKKNNKWCFAKPDYKPTKTADPDTPIVKSAPKKEVANGKEENQPEGDNAV